MTDNTAIEWTDATWNPVRGCSRVSEGCENCYAERVAARFSGDGQPYSGLIHPSTKAWNGKIKLVPEVLDQPLRWKRPRMIFVNSMSDLFHESVPDEYIDRVFAVMALSPQHTFQILTKRPDRMFAYTTASWRETMVVQQGWALMRELSENGNPGFDRAFDAFSSIHRGLNGSYLPNVWLGVSVEHQVAADERIPWLLKTPAAVRWLSCEPLLGPINFRWRPYAHEATGETYRGYLNRRGSVSHLESLQSIDWIVAGGESGPGARPMHPDWARSLRDQCADAGVPFFFKQWGEYVSVSEVEGPGAHFKFDDGATVRRTGKKLAGRTLDGVEHSQYPATAVPADS